MTENIAKLSMWTPDGVQVFFTVADPGAITELVDAATALIAALSERGFTPQPAGVEAGERIETVDAWVLGETSNGEPCVHLYRADFPNKFRIVTAWAEQIEMLPIDTSHADTWVGGAPERPLAERKGALQRADPPFRVVLKNVGTADEPRWRLARVLGASTPAPQNGKSEPGTGKTTAPNRPYAPAAFRDALHQAAQTQGATAPYMSDPKLRQRVAALLDACLPNEFTTEHRVAVRHKVQKFLFGVESLNDAEPRQVAALAYVLDGKQPGAAGWDKPDGMAVREIDFVYRMIAPQLETPPAAE